MTTLIVGASSRIGKAIAQRIEPAILHYCARPIDGEHVVQADLSTPNGIDRLIQGCAGCEITNLVYNVGPYLKRPLLETSREETLHLFETNLFVPMELVRKLVSTLKRIVFIGLAGLSPFRDDRRAATYRLSKLALWGYTRALAAELVPRGITVNMVSPGVVEGSVDQPAALPMNRLATPDEIAVSVVQFLQSTDYITGQNLEVAGGYAL